jgi:hypothetical protein
MLQEMAKNARPILNFPVIRKTRRNHGLEHATIHVLMRSGYRLSGRSTDGGFVLLGEVPTEAVESAVAEALRRMKGGEHSLAVHPNCGTNLATTSLLTSLVGLGSMSWGNAKDKFNRLPLVMVLMMFTILFSQPLGMDLQRYFTTEGDPGDLEVVSITRNSVRFPLFSEPVTIHRVVTRNG